MKRIGIITVSRTINFGAELQAFALQYKLNQLGYKAEVIDYIYYKNKRHIATPSSSPELNFKKKSKLYKFILYRIISPLIDIFVPLFHRQTRVKLLNFKNFHNTFVHFSKEFRSIDKLYKYSHNYDAYISGSDQVWNPATYSSLKPYLLDFVPEGKVKIAYAASFGVTRVSDEYKLKYRTLFEGFNFIGVREESGKNLIKEIIGRDAEIVLDPTLLLNKNDWKNVANKANINVVPPYILIYDLHPSQPLIEVTKSIQKKLKLPIYRVCKRSFNNPNNEGIINIQEAGPAEFVKLFINAAYVITNSFHGTIFSLSFNIPFNVVLHPGRSNNSRITDILKTTHLQKRTIWEDNICTVESSTDFSFESANSALYNLRNTSLEFLRKSI